MNKSWCLIFLLLLAASPMAWAVIPPGWSTNYNDLVSADTNQPALLYFSATWCGPCKMMASTTLNAPEIMEVFSNVTHVALDIDEHPDLASRYGVEAVPTMILLSGGQEVDRTTGYQPPEELLGWLTNGINKASAAVARLASDQVALTAVDQLLASPETNATHLAASKLFDLCAENENTVAIAAAKRLSGLAARDPVSVSNGLMDSRLAVRIQAANALRGVAGNDFDVDPWCDDATRQKAMDIWLAKLSRGTKP